MRRGTIVLTGATSGIGRAAAERLAARADRLVVQGPEPAGAPATAFAGDGQVAYVSADFTRLDAVVAAAAAIREEAGGPIDALINNAGVPGSPERRVTSDGHERTLQVNYLAMVLLTELLRPALASDPRVVNVGSATHEMASLDFPDLELELGYSPVRAYARSKLAIIMYTRWLARPSTGGLDAVSLSPGVVNTALLHAMFGAIGTSVEHGATNLIAALDSPIGGGAYFDDGREVRPSAEARDDTLADDLMAWTFAALGPFGLR